MELTGQRFINAPRAKVWTALLDAATLDACLRQDHAVRRLSDTAFEVGAPVHGEVTIAGSPPDALTFTAPNGTLRVTLAEEGQAMTRLGYVLEAAITNTAAAQAQIDQLIEAFQAQVSGPRELGASGAGGLQVVADRP